MTRSAYYVDFDARVLNLRERLRSLLTRLKAQGQSLAAYGASAKGATLLNFFGIARDLLDFVADRSTVKQGKLTPGSHLPILPPETLLERKPDYVLLLTWILPTRSSRSNRPIASGRQIIIPLPEVRVV